MRSVADTTLTARIATRLAAAPDVVAVVDEAGPRSLTRGELDRWSAALAARLRVAGAGPDRIVALLLERTVALPAAVLGVLRAGAAWLPLAVDDPPARLAALLADAAPVAVVTTTELRDRLPVDPGCPVLDVAADASGVPQDDPAGEHDLAYVIYTSGSTGMPKGVLTERHAILNRLVWMRDALDIGRDDVVLQKTPYTFDVSVWELLLPPLTGARMVLARPGGHRDAGYVAECVRRHGVTVLHFVPSVLADFLDRHPAADCASVRRVVVSGEALRPALAARFFRELPDVALDNLYGPTEAAIDVTHWSCDPAADPDAPVPIGFPITGAELSVRDAARRPLPDGTRGELCIGGPVIARGYLHRPELTRERFVPDPLVPGALLYRTGDLASRRADGALLYHGRDDDQVKLGGVRIELGEVESALASAPGVRRAAAAVRPTPVADVLAGWVVLDAGHDVPGVRAYLRGVLPAALVPSVLVAVDEIGMTRHGKVDRAALALPVHEVADTPQGHLSGVWAGLLGEIPGPDTDFFAVGGTSLLAVRLLARLRSTLGVRLELRDLMARPRFADLAAAVGSAPQRAPEDPLPVLGPEDRLPLSSAQQRMWFLQQMDPDCTAMTIVGGLRLTGPLDVADAARCLDAVVRAHESLRTVFPLDDDGPHAEVRAPARTPFTVVDLSTQDDVAAALRAELLDNAAEPFDLEEGPLVRARLLRLAEGHHVLALALHHIVTDGWSWSVLAADVLAAWAGRALPSAAAPRYVRYAAWERRRADGEDMAAQVDFWRDALVDAPAELRLPADGRRGGELSAAADWCDVPWPEGFADDLANLCAIRRTTPFAVLLTGYAAVLARLSGQDDVLVAAPVANRGRVDLEQVVGCFLNTLPLRVRIRAGSTFAELLAQVDDLLLDAHANSAVPFDRVVAALEHARGEVRSALFQSLLVVQNTPPWWAADEHRSVRVVELPGPRTHYDLKFEVFTQHPGLPARLVHASTVFGPERARRLAAQFAGFLGHAVADPHRMLAAYPLTDVPTVIP